jgi:hypothetical protein
MNLASRCREAISHVAMLKNELSMQQKRTAAALASQREQTQRMADSLSNSMELSRLSRVSSEETVDGNADDNALLVAATISPLRSNSRESLSRASSKSKISSRSSSPPEETRDSPPSDSASTPTSTLESSLADAIVEDTNEQVSTVSISPTDSPKGDLKVTQISKRESKPALDTPPKRGGKWVPNLMCPNAEGRQENEGRLFPHSASPQMSSAKQKLYNEEFPSSIQQGNDDGSGAFPSMSSQQRKIDLLNSIDAFEKSFSLDFPESFTPKEDNGPPGGGRSKTNIYNPFLSTPERTVGRIKKETDSFVYWDEEKKIDEPIIQLEIDDHVANFQTPPRVSIRKPAVVADEPSTPEKTSSGVARERYEKALQPRQSGANPGKARKTTSPIGLFRRSQNNHRNKQTTESTITTNVNEERGVWKSSVVEIVDVFEGNVELSQNGDKSRRLSLRRNIKQPISYAEPALNTKLRQGDIYFAKIEEKEQVRLISPPSVSP